MSQICTQNHLQVVSLSLTKEWRDRQKLFLRTERNIEEIDQETPRFLTARLVERLTRFSKLNAVILPWTPRKSSERLWVIVLIMKFWIWVNQSRDQIRMRAMWQLETPSLRWPKINRYLPSKTLVSKPSNQKKKSQRMPCRQIVPRLLLSCQIIHNLSPMLPTSKSRAKFLTFFREEVWLSLLMSPLMSIKPRLISGSLKTYLLISPYLCRYVKEGSGKSIKLYEYEC